MHHELRNNDPVRIKSIAKTASIDNDDNDNEDCDFDSNFHYDSEEEVLAISAHTVNPPKRNLRIFKNIQSVFLKLSTLHIRTYFSLISHKVLI